MFDNKRDVDNAVDKHLTANTNSAEASGSFIWNRFCV